MSRLIFITIVMVVFFTCSAFGQVNDKASEIDSLYKWRDEQIEHVENKRREAQMNLEAKKDRENAGFGREFHGRKQEMEREFDRKREFLHRELEEAIAQLERKIEKLERKKEKIEQDFMQKEECFEQETELNFAKMEEKGDQMRRDFEERFKKEIEKINKRADDANRKVMTTFDAKRLYILSGQPLRKPAEIKSVKSAKRIHLDAPVRRSNPARPVRRIHPAAPVNKQSLDEKLKSRINEIKATKKKAKMEKTSKKKKERRR